MKKIILLLLILSLKAFGYYSSEAFIDLLVQPNQLRVRTDRVGVLFGNENIRAAIGLTGANSLSGIIVHNVNDFTTLNNADYTIFQAKLASVQDFIKQSYEKLNDKINL